MANQLPATTRSQSIWTLALTGIAFFMVALDSLVVVTALPAIQRELHANLAALEWTVNAFTLAYAAGITTAAALGDRFAALPPRRRCPWLADRRLPGPGADRSAVDDR